MDLISSKRKKKMGKGLGLGVTGPRIYKKSITPRLQCPIAQGGGARKISFRHKVIYRWKKHSGEKTLTCRWS